MQCDDEAAAAAASTGLTAAQATSRSTAGEITRAMIPGIAMGGARFIACKRAPAVIHLFDRGDALLPSAAAPAAPPVLV